MENVSTNEDANVIKSLEHLKTVIIGGESLKNGQYKEDSSL